MEMRRLGRSELQLAPLAFGGNVFGWTADEKTSFRLLDAFVEHGYNLIDTADVYSRWAPGHTGGESETVIGRWLKQGGKRDRVLIATKVGMEMGPEQKGLSAAHIARAVEDSLRRLQVDVIDLYQAHADDAATPLEETLGAFDKLVRAGKVRAIGASNYSAPRLAAALAASAELGVARYESLQPLYNLYNRSEFESELKAVCLEHSVGVINYYPLAAGFLTGKYRSESDLSKSARGQGAKKYMNPRGHRILEALDAVAKASGTSLAAVALAWLIGRPGVTAPIVSATSLAQLAELMQAAELKLDASALSLLEEASRPEPDAAT